MPRRALYRFLLLALFLCNAAAATEPGRQSVSTSRQFIVFGPDLLTRGALCEFAERTKSELLGLLGERDSWIAPIVINAQIPRANLPETSRLNVDLGQTGFGIKLQLDVVIDSGLTRPEIRRELLRAIVLEMIYRNQPGIAAGSAYVPPPDWFLEGVPAQQSDLPRDRIANLLALPVGAKNVMPLAKFLTQQPGLLDAAGRTLYRAYAFALVDLLALAPEGTHRLERFLFDLPASSNDPVAELTKHFPEMFAADGGEQAWQREINRLAEDQPYQLLRTDETERRLAEMLRIKISESKADRTYELEEFGVFLKKKTARDALTSLGQGLKVLATRAHPVYGPVIAEYAEITALLRRGRTLDVPKRLERAAKLRKTIVAEMRGIDDYMNWLEATSAARPSGEFSEYLKAAQRAEVLEQPKRDRISVYLDALEIQLDEPGTSVR